jgi:hypothetical protein
MHLVLARSCPLTAALILFLSLCVQASATDLFPPRVAHENDMYVVRMAARLSIPREVLFDAVTDYDHLDRISSSILSSQVTGELEGGAKELHVRLKVCLMWLVCPTFRQVQEVVETRPTTLDAVIPDRMKNHFTGKAHWEFISDGDGTVIKFESRLTPRFWVPPWIGAPLIERVLIGESDRVLAGLALLYGNEKTALR